MQQEGHLDAEVQPRQGLGGLSLVGPRFQYLLEPLDRLQHVSSCSVVSGALSSYRTDAADQAVWMSWTQ